MIDIRDVKTSTEAGNITIQKFDQNVNKENFNQNIFSKQYLGKILT